MAKQSMTLIFGRVCGFNVFVEKRLKHSDWNPHREINTYKDMRSFIMTGDPARLPEWAKPLYKAPKQQPEEVTHESIPWCRKCMTLGHMEKECKNIIQGRNERKTYPARARRFNKRKQ